MTRIGVDLGGTNLRVASLDGAKILEQHKEPTGEPRDPQTIVDKLATLAEKLAPSGPATIGIGLAAMLCDRRGTVANSPHLRWRDVRFGELLKKRLGSRFSLGVYNDVNAIVWGEYTFGAARNYSDTLGVFVGTGIGGGLVVNGALVEGATNTAGEIGHVKVRWDDSAAPCACGQRGCVEAYVGGSYVQERITRELAAGASPAVVKLAGSVEAANAGHVDQAAGEGDAWALAYWEELAPLLAVTLGNAIAVLNSNRLVLGGGFLGRAPTLYELVVSTMPIVAPVASMAALSIALAELGDDAGLVGSADLAARGTSVID
ncbi:MAG TPA: ROK family protein [Kofleriaceae bacterium]|jgi:glucokinase